MARQKAIQVAIRNAAEPTAGAPPEAPITASVPKIEHDGFWHTLH